MTQVEKTRLKERLNVIGCFGRIFPYLDWIPVIGFLFLVLRPGSVSAAEPSEQPFLLPNGSNVTNVKDFGAVGDGVTDDTAAIQEAYNRTGMIYFPNGTYLISQTIRAPHRPGGVPSRRIIQGQSRDGVIIKLKDNAPGFDNPAKAKPMIITSWRIAQAFRNAVRDVTIDVGTGNPGAVGLEFFASNTGQIWNVTIRSSDPEKKGFAGLNMFADNGPLLVKGLNVDGFEYGIISDCNQLATFEHIRLSDQKKVGFDSRNKSIVRGLQSRNSVPAVVARGQGFTLLEAELVQTASTNEPAIKLTDGVATLLRDIQTTGYARSLVTPNVSVSENRIEEWTSTPVFALTPASPQTTLRLPIEETPDFETESVDKWVPITRFSPGELWVERKGRHRKENWAVALQAAIDSGATTIFFPAGRTYPMHGDVFIRGNVRHLIGMEATISEVDVSFSGAKLIIEDGQGDSVLIERFDSMYSRWTIENRSKRRLILRHLMADEIRATENAGDLFLDDVYTHFLSIHGQNAWARGLNMEHGVNFQTDKSPRPNATNHGGNLWILGLKTEQPRTKVRTLNGGKTEVYGYILANIASNPWPMFENENSTTTISVVESVLRQAPFQVLLENRCKDSVTIGDRQLIGAQGTNGAAVPLMTAACGPKE